MKRNSMPSYLLMVMVVLFSLFLAACGGDEADTAVPASDTSEVTTAESVAAPTAEPPPTNTVEPAQTATAEPSPTSEPSPTAEPTQEADMAASFIPFESAEGGFRLRHPEGWFVEDLFGLAILASTEELLDSPDPGEEGGVFVVTSGPAEDFDTDFGSRDPVEVIKNGFGDLAFGEDATLIEGPTATTINGLDAATAVISVTSENDVPLTAYMLVVIDETHAAVAFGATPEETADEFLPTFEAIGKTFELMEPVVEEFPDIDDGEALLPTVAQGLLDFGDVQTAEAAAGEGSSWEFLGLAGEAVDIVVTPLEDELDVVIDVVDEAGVSILPEGPVDDTFYDREEILNLSIPASGLYTIIVSGFFEADAGPYEISFNRAGSGTSESGSDSADLSYGETFLGSVSSAESAVSVSFAGSEGDIARVRVNPDEGLDVVVDIVDENGESLVIAGTDNAIGVEVVAASLPADGAYAVVVSSLDPAVEGNFSVDLDGPTGTAVFADNILDDDPDGHAFPFIADAGELVWMSVQPEGGLDVVVGLYEQTTDEELFVVDRTFDDEGLGYRVPEDGEYYFLITAVEQDMGSYDATLLGSDLVVFEVAFGDTAQGQFGAEEGLVDFLFDAAAGDTILLTLDTDSEADGVIEILTLDDTILADVDDFFEGETESLSYTFEADELVIIRVSNFFFESGRFDLQVESE